MILLGMTLILQFEEIWYLHVRFRNKFLEMYELNVEGKIKWERAIKKENNPIVCVYTI